MPSTPIHHWTLPQPGASTDTWGAELNAAFGQVDAAVAAKLDKTNGVLGAASGNAAAPSLSFSGDPNTGFYWVAADSIGLSLGGVAKVTYAAGAVTVAGGVKSNLPAVTALAAPLNLGQGAAGVNPTTPVNGDLWVNASGVFAQVNGATRQLDTTNWSTPRSLSLTGDVTATLSAVDGSGNVSAAATIAANAITNAKLADNAVGTAELINNAVDNDKLADMAGNTIKGRRSTTGNPEDLTPAQVSAMLDLSQMAIGTGGALAGYFKIGPLYLMWGVAGSPVEDASVAVSLPLTLPNGVLVALATPRNPAGNSAVNIEYHLQSQTASSVTFYANSHSTSATPSGFNWFVLGH